MIIYSFYKPKNVKTKKQINNFQEPGGKIKKK